MTNVGARLPVRNPDSRINLTDVESILHSERMARFRDILSGLYRQTKGDAEEIHAMNDKMNEFHSAYLKYKELAEQVKRKEERMRIAASLIANTTSDFLDNSTDLKRDQELARICSAAGMPVEGDQLRLELYKFPMWILIREIVRQTPEMQIVELENALFEFGAKTSRQAIESALETHRKEFRIVKRGRDKFVSLKGA
jgi:hypothetical protein